MANSYSGQGYYPNPSNAPTYPTYPTLNPHAATYGNSNPNFYNGVPSNPSFSFPNSVRSGYVNRTYNPYTGQTTVKTTVLPWH